MEKIMQNEISLVVIMVSDRVDPVWSVRARRLQHVQTLGTQARSYAAVE